MPAKNDQRSLGHNQIQGRALFLLILILGLILRLNQIGTDLFWLDEVGVAIGSGQVALREALAVTRSHIMGMPLDYIIAWFIGRVSNAEGVLRLPEALWGTLTLIPAYLLFRKLSDSRTALLGMFLLAITPIHIRYSQELRFYAPLVFFYTTASLLGLKAVRQNRIVPWLIFTAVTMLGILFHVFTALVILNVLLWILLSGSWDRSLLGRATAGISLIAIFMAVAILTFGNFPGYQTSLQAFEPFPRSILAGLGWMPAWQTGLLPALFGALCMLTALRGILVTLGGCRDPWNLAIPITILLQAAIILAVDLFEHYFLSSRQLLILLPFAVYLSALGIFHLVGKGAGYVQARLPGWKHAHLLLTVGILALIALADIPALISYYRAEKAPTPYIVGWLTSHHLEGQPIAIYPDYEERNYSYYLPRWDSRIEIPIPVHPEDFNQGNIPGQYLITSGLTAQEQDRIIALGYSWVYTSPAQVLYPHSIWEKSGDPALAAPTPLP